MGWQDAPVVRPAKAKQPWEDAPIVKPAQQQESAIFQSSIQGAGLEADRKGQNPVTGQSYAPPSGALALPMLTDVLGVPSRMLATLRGQKMTDDSYLLKPNVEAAQANPPRAYSGPFSPPPNYAGTSEIAGRIASDPLTALPGLAAGAKAALKSERVMAPVQKAANLPNKYAAKAAQELSSVSSEALSMASTKEGRKLLQANAGKEYEIGQRLVNMMDDAATYNPNKVKIDHAVKNMGEVDLMPVVKALQDAKVKRPSGKLWGFEKQANAMIQDDINAILGTNGSTKFSAAEALDLRRGFDKGIDFGPEGKRAQGIVDAAKKKARLQMKTVLEEKAKATGHPEYIEAMADYHKQLDARDRLEAFLGANKEAQQDRAESFISNMWGKNKRNRQKVMEDIGEVFGQDFLQESKLANLAAQLGPEGKATLWSRASTGRSKLGGALMFPFSSPAFATRVTLPLSKLPGKSVEWLRGLAGAKSPSQAAFYTKNLEAAGLSKEEIAAGVEAVKAPNAAETVAKATEQVGIAEPIKAQSKTARSAMEAQFNASRRAAAMKYLQATTGKEPTLKETYQYLGDLGDKPVPKPPEKPKVQREFKGRRDERTLAFFRKAISEGLPDAPTKTMQAKDAPESFILQGTKFKRVKSKWDNLITYKDEQGQHYNFRGDETIHMDYAPDEVPF